MNRFDMIQKIGDQYHIGNTESGESCNVKVLASLGLI